MKLSSAFAARVTVLENTWGTPTCAVLPISINETIECVSSAGKHLRHAKLRSAAHSAFFPSNLSFINIQLRDKF